VLEKLNWASNTLRLGKWSVARVEVIDGDYIGVVLLPGLEGRRASCTFVLFTVFLHHIY
jgi:hypothetical protein